MAVQQGEVTLQDTSFATILFIRKWHRCQKPTDLNLTALLILVELHGLTRQIGFQPFHICFKAAASVILFSEAEAKVSLLP